MSALPHPVVPAAAETLGTGASRAEDASTDMLHHAMAIRDCAGKLGLTARVNLVNFRLALRGRGRYYDLFAQFNCFDDGRQRYMPAPEGDGSTRFIGWLPYFNKNWPFARDKLRFKALCSSEGLRTPPYWTRPEAGIRNVIVKPNGSSFGVGIRGPFATVDGVPEAALSEGEYFEQFVPGTIAKTWYWDAQPVCMETYRMPSVTGDGRRSMYELAMADAPRSRVPVERSALEPIARYQGVEPDDVLPAGRTVITDFRYVSPLLARSTGNSNVLPQYAGTEIERQLGEAGAALWRHIPADIRKGTAWTADSIIEEDAGRIWLLEMNSNPALHPRVYPAIVEALFGPDADEVIAAAKKAMRGVIRLPGAVERPGGAPQGLGPFAAPAELSAAPSRAGDPR